MLVRKYSLMSVSGGIINKIIVSLGKSGMFSEIKQSALP
jgi:hypothetical protein